MSPTTTSPSEETQREERVDGTTQLERYQRVYEASPDAIVMIDDRGTIVQFNRAAEEIFGYTNLRAVQCSSIDLLVPEKHRERYRQVLDTAVADTDREVLGRRHRLRALRADGSTLLIEAAATVLDDQPLLLGVFVRDITAEVEREQALTALARDNTQILNSAGDGICRVGVDGRITYANPAAGSLLRCDAADLIGRSAHGVLHHSHADGTIYPHQQCPIRAAFQEGAVAHVTDEVFWRPDGTSFPVDYTAAPIREGNRVVGAVCIFADISEQREREQELRERAEWTERIHVALRTSRFVLHAQPIYRLGEDEPAMHELLIRMRGEDGELLPPDSFLPQAERFGLSAEIDRWVVREGVRLAAHRCVSINLSAPALSEPGFTEWLGDAIESAKVDPANLVFEITETAALRDMDVAVAVVKRLTALGCGFALDDFGTGYGSFAELKRLPLTYLKIDRDFVCDLCENEADRRTVTALVSVARGFGMETIAEGIEREEILDWLRDAGVDFVQGYHLGRPGPLPEATG
jgi:PAS domain S-box-containing protein